MKNFINASLIFIIWVSLAFIWHLNFHNTLKINNIDNSKSAQIKPITEKSPAFKKDTLAKSVIINPQQINILKSNFIIYKDKIRITTPTNFIEIIDSINKYLNQNPSKKLVISAAFLSSEKDNKTPLNYGVIRAIKVKNKIIKAGVNPDQIFIKDTLSSFTYSNNLTYENSIKLRFVSYTKLENKAKTAQILHKTLYAYFGNKEFNYDTSLKTYISNLSNFILENPNAKIIIEGHTDSQGPLNGNYWVGFQRAQNVKQFLIKKGIPKKNITVISKGEIEPIANNNLKEGRILNRRIEIYIQ